MVAVEDIKLCIFSGMYFKCVKNSTVLSFAIEISRIAMDFIASIMPEVFQNALRKGVVWMIVRSI